MVMNVLLVEDNPGDALLVRKMMEEPGAFDCKVEHVDRLSGAMEVLAAGKTDAVLLDLGLPDSRGDATAIKLHSKFPNVPLIVLTGNEDEEMALRLVHDGAQDYLVKGEFSRAVLVRSLRHAVERKNVEEKLRNSQETLLTAQRVANLGSWSIELPQNPKDPGVLHWSDQVYRIMGYDPGAVEPSVETYIARVHADDREKLLANLAESTSSGNAYHSEHRIVRADGVERIITAQADVLRDPQTQRPVRMIGMIQDVTESRRAVEYLRRSEERYRELLENANDLIYTLDLEGRLTSVNRAFETVMDYRREDVLGRSMFEFLPPEKVEESKAVFQRQLSGEPRMVYEAELISRNRRVITLEVSSQAIHEGSTLVGVQRISRDMTERRQMEQQLRQSQKMEAIGRLAGGIAHDFNNLLNVIIGYAELQLGDPEVSDTSRKRLGQIMKAGQSAAALTRQLLAFSRKQMIAPQVLNLNTVVSQSENLLKRLIGEDIEFGLSLAPDLGKIEADPTQLEQIVMNLVLNSRDAMPDGGKLRIETANAEMDESHGRQIRSLVPGKYVRLEVSDTGFGMDAETQAHIFEPFFTTKGKGKGTGLGLATVYGAVKQSGGFIFVESEAGRGTTFKIFWPRLDDAVPISQPIIPPAGSFQGTTATILLVEDEDSVRVLARELLESAGYTVITPQDAAEAVRAAAGGVEFDLLVTDIVMPGMSGPDLVRHLRDSRPNLRVLYMSGYNDDLLLHKQVTRSHNILVEKPFTREALVTKVQEALGKRSAAVSS